MQLLLKGLGLCLVGPFGKVLLSPKTCCIRNPNLFHFCFLPKLLLCFAFLMLLPASANALKPFWIGTGGKTGVYYPIGKLIATGLTLKAQEEAFVLNGYIGVAQNSAGSIENLQSVVSGKIQAGLVQADIAAFAYKGDAAFGKLQKTPSVRVIASLYPEKFQIVVRKDAGIRTFWDLKGKKIAVDEPGSGTLSVMRIILEAHNMTENELLPLYLKPFFTQEKLKNGELQGFVVMAGTPMVAVTQLHETGITLVPIDPLIVSSIYKQYPYLFPGKVGANIYSGVPETPTLEVFALLVVDEQMPDEIAYAITELLFSKETSTLLKEGHPQGRAITLDTALDGITIPLHPGAERFYRENNVLN